MPGSLIVFNKAFLLRMSLNVKLRRMGKKKPPAGWDIIEPTLEEFEAKMREAETDPHEGKRKSEAIWPVFRVSFVRISTLKIITLKISFENKQF